MAGVPFETVERLYTPATSAAGRELLLRRDEFSNAKAEVEEILRSRTHGLSKELFRAWHKAIRSGTVPPIAGPPSRAFAACWNRASKLANAEAHFDQSLQRELKTAREALLDSGRTILPLYLVFAAIFAPFTSPLEPKVPDGCFSML